jgi:hypothetical protein
MTLLSQALLHEGISGGKSAVGLVTGGAGALIAGAKAFQIVSGNEMGVRTHNKSPYRKKDREYLWLLGRVVREGSEAGEAYGVVGPGVYPVVPFLHPIVTVNVKDRHKVIQETVNVTSDEGEVFGIKAGAIWRVRDDGDNPIRALYNVDRNDKDKDDQAIEGMLELMCAGGIREAYDGKSRDTISSLSFATDAVRVARRDRFDHYGLHLEKLEIYSSRPIDVEIQSNAISNGIREALGSIMLGQQQVDIPEQRDSVVDFRIV